MVTDNPDRLRYADVTPRSVYLSRRELMISGASGLAAAVAMPGRAGAAGLSAAASSFSTSEPQTRKQDATTYNNFYEFGTDKADPSRNSGSFKPTPWTLEIGGLVAKPVTLSLDDVMKAAALEERIYRLRCVEAWSMVIPWIGIPLSALLAKVEPLGSAKYVALETIVRPSEMPGQKGLFQPLPWPYVEGLRIDEARHPLTIMALGMYGEVLPNQNGAPMRLVVPWKYGFKSIKSIVKISFTEMPPPTSWNISAPREYGFYSNVNPEIDHPRWSQATERRIGEGSGLTAKRRPTLMFNGYAEQVASLYSGMDLKANY